MNWFHEHKRSLLGLLGCFFFLVVAVFPWGWLLIRPGQAVIPMARLQLLRSADTQTILDRLTAYGNDRHLDGGVFIDENSKKLRGYFIEGGCFFQFQQYSANLYEVEVGQIGNKRRCDAKLARLIFEYEFSAH